MKKFLLYIGKIAAVVLPLSLVVVGINYFVDPANIYHEEVIDEILEGFRQGKNVTNVPANKDERHYRKAFIEQNRGRSFDYLVMGSSRAMCISTDAVDGTLLNIGVSGCTVMDMIALWQLCKENGVTARNVIINVDPPLFNPNDRNTRWHSIAEYYDKFTEKDSGICPFESKRDNLLSPSYFKSSLISLVRSLKGREANMVYTDLVENEGMTDRKDGSIYYDKKYRDTPQEEVDRVGYEAPVNYANYDSLSEEKEELFDQLLDDMAKERTTPMFYCCPVHPCFYAHWQNDSVIMASITYINELAAARGIKVIGHFDPREEGFDNTDFYDLMHMKKESVDVMVRRNL